MTNLPFHQRLHAGERLIGTLVSVPSPDLVEALSLSGLDWLFVDMEHGALDRLTVIRCLQAMRPPCAGIVRVPAADASWLQNALDAGAHGLIVPHVNSAAEAQAIVSHCKYPPEGARSVGISRAHGYGRHFAETMRTANARTVLIAQIEHINAVRNIDAIAAVEGIDALFVGPYDLSASMGKVGQPGHPDVVAAIKRVTDACRGKKPLGIFGANPDAVRPYLAEGYTILAVGMDLMLLVDAASDIVAGLRE